MQGWSDCPLPDGIVEVIVAILATPIQNWDKNRMQDICSSDAEVLDRGGRLKRNGKPPYERRVIMSMIETWRLPAYIEHARMRSGRRS